MSSGNKTIGGKPCDPVDVLSKRKHAVNVNSTQQAQKNYE